MGMFPLIAGAHGIRSKFERRDKSQDSELLEESGKVFIDFLNKFIDF